MAMFAWLCLLLVARTCAQESIVIDVVQAAPGAGLRLAAAAAAAAPEAVLRVAPAEPGEPLALPAHLCRQAADGSQAALGAGGAGAAGGAAARAGLPLLLAAPAPAPATSRAPAAALELYPHEDLIAEACAALCVAKGWQHGVLLHEGSARAAAQLAARAAEARAEARAEAAEPPALRARLLPPPADDDALRNLLLVLKKWGALNFIVWCGAECSVRVLDAAQRVGLLSERHSYLLPALDLHTQPLRNYSYGGANITTLRLFDPKSEVVVQAMAAWREEYTKQMGAAVDEEEIAQIVANPPTELVLAFDAVRLVAEAAARLELPLGSPADCGAGAAAFHADTLLNYIRSEEWVGVSGPLRWRADGARGAAFLQAVELERGGKLRAAAAWAPSSPLTWVPRAAPPPPASDVMTNRTFTVVIAQNKPYVMRQQSADRLSGNDRYEGFCIELIDRLSKLLNFNYTLVEQIDGAYGTRNKTTGQWNGMMRRLMDDPHIDFAITDLTITAEREEAVDFTTPFMNLGISILFRKPQPPEPALLAFLLPFSNGVWLCLGFAYLGTSLVLYVVGRLCPEEWQNPYPCVDEPPALENQFTLANALWFNLGAVLLQGSEIAPVAYGTRAVASVWWLFALVITSSYTANLATLLATKTSTELIHNARELAENELGINYGAKAGGSTYTFFEFSNSELFKLMYEHMKEQEMPNSNEAGIDKVMNENYAFFAESTTIEYTVERNCEVVKVGDLLDSKGYGIAMKKNSPYRHSLNLALLNLQEAGVLREMKHLWWKEKHGGGACQEGDDRESQELAMPNFLGLFLVLVVGCALGIVVSCGDLLWAAWRSPRDPRPLGTRLSEELRFVFRFEQSVKPVRGPLVPPSSPSPPAPEESPLADVAAPSPPRSPTRLRSPSLRSHRSARRSSMHAASARLARHRPDSDE